MESSKANLIAPSGLLLTLMVAGFFAVACGSQGELQCVHSVSMADLVTGVHQPAASHVHKRTADQNFRIFVHYDSSINSNLSASTRSRLQNTIVPQMTSFFEQTLRVRATGTPILLDRTCDGSFFLPTTPVRRCVNVCRATTMCGTVPVPVEHLKACTECNGNFATCNTIGSDGPGVANHDFILYVSAVQTSSCGSSTLAFAASCEMEDVYDRPIAGYTNFCPNALTGDKSDEQFLAVAKHELLHALAFSSSLYPFWRNETGNPRTPRDQFNRPPRSAQGFFVADESTLRTVNYNNWQTRTGTVLHTVTQLVTPKIVAEGRRHFNCPSLEGVEVENQGGSGTEMSHWEERILQTEVMTGSIALNSVFSRLTFALLEDSGWYTVDYSRAEQLVWGRNAGCELPTGSCGGYIQSRQQQGNSISPYCNRLSSNSDTSTRCSVDRLYKSQCNLREQGNAVPSEYQYFNSGENFNSGSVDLSRLGGSLTIADYCPFQSPFSNRDCSDPSNSPGTGTSNRLAETYAQGSRCVEHSQRWNVTNLGTGSVIISTSTNLMSGCYQYSCSSGQVTIFVLGTPFACSSVGQEISVDVTVGNFRYRGSLICPSCLEICYDDFANCPEAASVYSEFAGPSSSISSSTSSPVVVTSTLAAPLTSSAIAAIMSSSDISSSTTQPMLTTASVESTSIFTTAPSTTFFSSTSMLTTSRIQSSSILFVSPSSSSFSSSFSMMTTSRIQSTSVAPSSSFFSSSSSSTSSTQAVLTTSIIQSSSILFISPSPSSFPSSFSSTFSSSATTPVSSTISSNMVAPTSSNPLSGSSSASGVRETVGLEPTGAPSGSGEVPTDGTDETTQPSGALSTFSLLTLLQLLLVALATAFM